MPWIPFVKTGYLGTNRWVPLVNGNGLTAGGGEPIPEIVWKKVSGTSPLSLPDAIANSIKSLVQFGKCSTSGGDIYCNNGKLTAVDDELPTGYKRLLGITFDGNFHYKTGEALAGSDDVTMTLDNLASSGKNVFGSYNGANDKNFSLYIYGSSTSGSYFRYGDQLKRPKYGGTGKRTITFGASGTSGFAEDSTVDPDEFTTPANVYIGMLPNSSSAAFTGDIVGSILVSNRLEWIPCERESDGVIGYYEKYNRNFIAPSGSGTPVSLGYDTSHLTVLSVVGTPEVLNIMSGGGVSYDTLVDKTYTGLDGDGDSNYLPFADFEPLLSLTGDETLVVTIDGVEYRTDDTEYNAVLDVGSTVVIIGVNYNDPDAPFPAPQPIVNITVTSSTANLTCEDGGTMSVKIDVETSTGVVIATATVQNLLEVGGVADEQDIISGVITRKVEVSVANGVITLSALDTPVTEQTTPQPLSTVEGDNTVSVTAEVSPIQLECEYANGFAE